MIVYERKTIIGFLTFIITYVHILKALSPTPCTIAAIGGALCCPYAITDNGCTCATCPVQEYCCGCSTSLLSCLCAFPPCIGYLRHLFGFRIQRYIEALTSKTKPKKILVCMIYYLDENPNTLSWASPALGAMGYNSNPDRLQMVIRKMYSEGTR